VEGDLNHALEKASSNKIKTAKLIVSPSSKLLPAAEEVQPKNYPTQIQISFLSEPSPKVFFSARSSAFSIYLKIRFNQIIIVNIFSWWFAKN